MTNRILSLLLIIVTFLITISCSNSENTAVKKNKSTVFDQKVDSIMQLMTLQEKIGQTVMFSGSGAVTGPTVNTNFRKFIKEASVGAMLNVYSAKGTRELQKLAVEETRLGIPLLFGYDVIHGFKTIFPINLGLAASWDMANVEKGSRIAAEEASAAGIHWTFAPMVDVGRDPRWGRISEGAGEDVYLGSKMAKAYVKGFQGEDLSKTNTILACAKHFVGYGAAQAGRDYHTVNMGEGELRNVYLPPFKAAIDEGVETFMTAFNELNGVPATGSKFLYRDILRDEWNFSGFVVTDYTAINELVMHGFAKDNKDATRIAINAGIDMDMMSDANRLYLAELVKEGKVDIALIDDACRRILLSKYKLGLFDDPYKYADEQREKEVVSKPAFLEAARHSAAISSVLLKNNDKSLPLSSDKKIGLIGPLAKDKENIIGNWAAAGDRGGEAISIFEGIQEYTKDANILYVKGCEIEGDDESGFQAAINVARTSDIVVMVMGEDYDMSGEAASRTNINLPGKQTKLIESIRKAVPNKKIVLVLMNGRPLDLSAEDLLADAILETWFPGTMGGNGVADVLFGKYNPSGKLTVTFPRNIGQIPIYYNMKNTGRPIPKNNPKEDYKSNYLDVENSPLYVFGHGLSYTTFKYSNVELSSETISFSDTLIASVTITNTGDYDGHEVLQLYIHDRFASATRPVKELKGFEKVFLKKGESKTVSFEIKVEDLKFYNSEMIFGIEAGVFDIGIEGTSDFEFKKTFTLTE
ncbi:glycosyl hydrolase [Polaribacter filamentus]|uniref:beta-glucosidase n=1 Tax=Polaribacter filamentus TaxID=53483 RepID=A0A2S7KYA5_9FLAO|nr:glycoside hydrolase family 3 N-terminal domain-containing protein [Polaribacter filamentus]PQB07652.1 glycosyl hydrolase [Polaribacter filamentus]